MPYISFQGQKANGILDCWIGGTEEAEVAKG